MHKIIQSRLKQIGRERLWARFSDVCFLVAAFLLVFIGVYEAGIKNAQNVYEDLSEEVSGEADTEDETEAEETSDPLGVAEDGTLTALLQLLNVEIPEKNLDWDALHETNEDIYAWLYVPDVGIDYPVLQDPEDDSYYLLHNLDGSEGYPGCIYTEATYNSTDFLDPNTVLYGHNMRDDSMFGALHDFDDAEFFNDGNHYIYIYMEDVTYVYLVFSASEYTSAHVMASNDFSTEEGYEAYLESLLSGSVGRFSNIREDLSVTTENRIITLATCTPDSSADYRFLVSGILINPPADSVSPEFQ